MLENLLETIDPGLESWGMYLIAACKYLQKKNYYHILYELQQFMKVRVIAHLFQRDAEYCQSFLCLL